jgi:hypothetical protein
MPEKDVLAEAVRIAKEASERKITLKLFGGIAFRLRAPSAQHSRLKRNYTDIDFMGLRNQRKQITELFTSLGYTPRTTFNAMNGDLRLIFNDIENGRRVDIFLNVFEMCHKFDFTDRLKLDDLTLPLADLLLTKLQVYEITEREYKDVIAFLYDHRLSDVDDQNTINQKYISKLCSNDWGLWKTVNLNLERIWEAVPTFAPEHQEVVKDKITQLKKKIDEEPKSFGWKMRARVGDKVKWYELPEADREVVDSRPVDEKTADVKASK